MPLTYASIACYALCLLLAYVAAFVLTRVSMTWAARRGIVSHVTQRSSHTVPTPRLGGVGLALGFGLPALLFLVLLARNPYEWWRDYFDPALVLWGGAGWLLMLVVGLLDDVYDLRPLVKLGLMTLAAALPAAGVGSEMPLGTGLLFGVLTLGWLLFFTNGYNFMDGMDGFAGNFARFAALGMFAAVLLSALLGEPDGLASLTAYAWLLPLLAMACSGFLYWNRPPARVFMGDGGSLSTGYLLALYGVVGAYGGLGRTLPLACSLTILLPFVFDVVLTLIRRARRGENLLKAHREHLYQRLMRSGMSHAQVLRINLMLFAICAALGAGAAALRSGLAEAVALGVALAVMTGYWLHVLRRERATVSTHSGI